jgi:molybdopterin/thiamine biosynthesis adenylyltransferase
MAKKTERAAVIGVGGIGKFLLSALARFLAYDQERTWTLVLVDGDGYEVKNAQRQAFSKLGNKAEVTAEELRVQFPELVITAIPAFVAAVGAQAHTDHERMTVPIDQVIHEGDWVFMCVDNHATRKMVSDFVQTLNNIRLISGGNDYTDGNVQIVIRRNWQNVFPSLDQFHPEIAQPADRPPFAMSCEELAQAGSPQLIFANQMAAALMCAVFWGEMNRRLQTEEVYFDLCNSVSHGPAVRAVSRKSNLIPAGSKKE